MTPPIICPFGHEVREGRSRRDADIEDLRTLQSSTFRERLGDPGPGLAGVPAREENGFAVADFLAVDGGRGRAELAHEGFLQREFAGDTADAVCSEKNRRVWLIRRLSASQKSRPGSP